MARINIEDSLWKDDRFQDLMIRVGNRHTAKGMLIELWSLAQEYWYPEKKLIPKERIQRCGLDLVIDVGLAEERDGGVFAIGSEKAFEWLFERQAAGKKGGLAKASKAKLSLANDSKSKQTVASSSSSSSSSEFKEEEIYTCVEIWAGTLSRMGIQKSAKLDEGEIGRLIQRHGVEKTKLALLGAGFEAGSPKYDPKKHVSIRRLSRPDVFETFVNLGAQNQPVERKAVAWDLPLGVAK